MSQRFKNVKKGGLYNLALQNYNNYLANPANQKNKKITGVGPYNPKTLGSGIGAIVPFTDKGTGALEFLTKYSKNAEANGTGLKTTLEPGRLQPVTTAAPAPAGSQKPPQGFRAAKATVFVPGAGPPVETKSKFTGLYYLKYPGHSFGMPFGMATGDSSEFNAGENIRASLQQALQAGGYTRVSVTPERIPMN